MMKNIDPYELLDTLIQQGIVSSKHQAAIKSEIQRGTQLVLHLSKSYGVDE